MLVVLDISAPRFHDLRRPFASGRPTGTREYMICTIALEDLRVSARALL